MNVIQYFMALLTDDKRHIWFHQDGVLGHTAKNSIEVLHSFFSWRKRERILTGVNGPLETRICAPCSLPSVGLLRR